MPRGRQAPAAALAPVLSAPVVVDMSLLTIGDIKTFAKLSALASKPEESLTALPEIIDLLDRIVEGGVSQRPMPEMQAVIDAVNRAMTEAANPKN